MKRTPLITLTIALGIALFQPLSASAKDHARKEGGQGKGQAQTGKAHGNNGGNKGQQAKVSSQPRSPSSSGKFKAVASHRGNGKPGNASVAAPGRSRVVPNQSVTAAGAKVTTSRYKAAARAPGAVPSTSRYSRQPGYAGQGRNGGSHADQRSYTRDNNYGGLWTLGDNHRDWQRNRVHSWNNHRYGWFDGGWLIIDGGFRPQGYFYSNYSNDRYSNGRYSSRSGDSTVMQVQTSLAEKGYPVGNADGVIGPATRTAISEYQQDYGLAVTGRINTPLLASLGLE